MTKTDKLMKPVISVFMLIVFSLLNFTLVTDSVMENQDAEYIAKIKKHRIQKDAKFKDKEKSPFKKRKERKQFDGLKYFEANEDYKVKAFFIETEGEERIAMPTSGNMTKNYFKYGELHFEMKGRNLKLNVYQNEEFKGKQGLENFLFLPFTDLTNGKDSYGGGRYMNLKGPIENIGIMLDFNYALNPYCAYSEEYICPLPPRENFLPIRVEAGEKNFYTY